MGLKLNGEQGRFLFDTSIPGNLNLGHEFRNLRLDEFEDLLPNDVASQQAGKSLDSRWADVLEIPVDT